MLDYLRPDTWKLVRTKVDGNGTIVDRIVGQEIRPVFRDKKLSIVELLLFILPWPLKESRGHFRLIGLLVLALDLSTRRFPRTYHGSPARDQAPALFTMALVTLHK
jgi:hypothetical protein